MNGFIFRICAYHGEPVVMNKAGVRARTGLSIDSAVPEDRIVNDPNNAVVKDMANQGKETDYDIGALIDEFQEEYGCKVNYDFDIEPKSGEFQVFEFDIFEPSWPDDDEAKEAIDDLSERLVDWAEGFPTGR